MELTAQMCRKYENKAIRVYCTDGDVCIGVWLYHTSDVDNEPDGESITLRTERAPYVEIYVEEIERIEAV
jgi:hypothetical protein